MFFQDWASVGRTLAVGIPAYVLLICLLRISGKRTLSKMNAFDLVITVAFGSALATVLLSKQTSLAQGVTAFAFLVVGQAVITWLSVRSRTFQKLIKATPTLLYYNGQYLDAALQRERVTREEIQAAARAQGMLSMKQVRAVVLETEGSMTIMPQTDSVQSHDLLDEVARPRNMRT